MPALHGGSPRVLRSAEGKCGRAEDQGGPTERRRTSITQGGARSHWKLVLTAT
jgi:hypothetical protein